MNNDEPVKKVSVIISKGSLESIYPGLILANSARMEGIEANLFFTFYGLEAITEKKMDKIKAQAPRNLPALLRVLPGVEGIITRAMLNKIKKLDIPPVREFIEMIHDSGCRIYACRASVDIFGLKKEDFCRQVDGIISAGEFYGLSAGASIIFT